MSKRVFKTELDAVNNSLQAQVTNSISKTIVDAKGDLITATGADTPARLAVGSDGETLVADSSASTGLRWQATTAAGKNLVINGGMDYWQRGTSIAAANGYVYSADRWQGFNATTYTVSRQDVSSLLNNFQYALRAQRNSGSTATNYFNTEQGFETSAILPYRGKVVTISFWARCGANFSASSSQIGVTLFTGTGTERVRNVTAYTNEATPINTNATLTTTYQKFTFTSTTLATNITQMCLTFSAYPTGTAGANDWYEVTGVQLEVGSVATEFTRAGGTLAGELAACQRYFFSILGSDANASNQEAVGVGTYLSTTGIAVTVSFKSRMRVGPTVSHTGGGFAISGGGGGNATTVASTNFAGPNAISLNFTSNVASTAGYSATVLTNASDCRINFSSEL